MDARSESFFAQMEPDLVAVLRAAAQMPQPWVVVYGIRSPAVEAQCVATGHSTTMHSRHIADCKGLAAAADVAALINGKVSFAYGQEQEVFGQIISQIKAAGVSLNIPIECGIDWVTFKDFGHIQLPWKEYP